LTLREVLMATAEEPWAALGEAMVEVCVRYGNTQPLTSSEKPIYGVLAPPSRNTWTEGGA